MEDLEEWGCAREVHGDVAEVTAWLLRQDRHCGHGAIDGDGRDDNGLR